MPAYALRLFCGSAGRMFRALVAGGVLLGVSACGVQGAANQGQQTAAACSGTPSQHSSSVLVASKDHFVGDGLDVTAVARLDPNYGVNGTIDVVVTVRCPAGVSDVSTSQSYEAYGSTVQASLSEVAHSGDTWTFALFADNLSGSHPFQVGLFRHALSGSGRPPFAVIVFPWPPSLVKHMAG